MLCAGGALCLLYITYLTYHKTKIPFRPFGVFFPLHLARFLGGEGGRGRGGGRKRGGKGGGKKKEGGGVFYQKKKGREVFFLKKRGGRQGSKGVGGLFEKNRCLSLLYAFSGFQAIFRLSGLRCTKYERHEDTISDGRQNICFMFDCSVICLCGLFVCLYEVTLGN